MRLLLTIGVAPVSEGQLMDPAAPSKGEVIFDPFSALQRDGGIAVSRDADYPRFALPKLASAESSKERVSFTSALRLSPSDR